MGTRTAAIYCRISRDTEDLGLGVARQRQDCEALAQQKHWDVGGIYSDNDVSAFSGKRRPEYQRMLDDLKNGVVDAVIAWHPDRLHRSPREIEDFIDLLETVHFDIATCTAGDIDLTTSDGRVVARIACAIARKESEDKSRRLRRKKLELAELGQVAGGGSRPFGYANDRVTLVHDEAEEIRAAALRILAGDSLRSIALDWHARNVTTVRGGRWTTATIRQVLMSWRISGQRAHKGKLIGQAVWPAIITPDEAVRLRAILTNPSRNTVGARTVRTYLLSGFVWCERCEIKMGARPTIDGRRRYVCIKERGGCGRCGIDAEQLEELIVEAALQRLDEVALGELLEGDRDDVLEVQNIAGLEADLERLAHDHYVAKAITRAEFMAARAPIADLLDAAKEATARRRPSDVLGGLEIETLRGKWDSDEYSLDRKRAILGIAIESVWIAPAPRGTNRFRDDRVSVAWKM